ncbi:SDR family NAD(P)-dependent oxidoreductase [Paraburkholderia humisilvae]|uniref:1,4-dihydroxy-2-naphthoyl-CoA synthase n=1 Tax=Paraburkholderia humisilvae TaxID=627669 RepID=A0A6J5EHV0_9BURK|nr:SDR family NAD(P)-dependent oxidoreductase [Paraburkholderia humisilvae]CAB3765823.1 1,4-dihydroxy-2-naphthoyl-CoA synthase [Paraburkholderia humisilvae]
MKKELESIYRELAAGALSKDDALQRIGAVRDAARASTWFAAPEWAPADAWRDDAPITPAEEVRHVLLTGFADGGARAVASRLAVQSSTVLAAGPEGDVGAAYTRLALAVFEHTLRLLAAKPRVRHLMQLVVAGDDDAQWATGLAGLFETARLEAPLVRGQIVFVPAHAQPEAIARQIDDASRTAGDTVFRYADDGRRARRWQIVDDLARERDGGGMPEWFREQGVYLITGGAGGLGRLFAQQILAQRAHARVILAGRRAPGDTELDALRALGTVEFRTLDVTDAAQTDALVSAIVRDHGGLHGVVHSAGQLRDEFIIRKTAQAFADVLAPKVTGTVNLDAATRTLDLDFMVLFSSIASWAGNVGQADYAAANGFVEQFARHRARLASTGERRGQTLAIAWPHWRDGGMHVDVASMEALQRRTGLRSLITGTGMLACHRAIALNRPQLLVMHGEATSMRAALNAPQTQPVPPVRIEPKTSAAGHPGLPDLTRAFLCASLASVLKMPAERIDPRAPLEQYGIDSIVAMTLTSRLEETFGTLAKTLFFEYRTLDELAGYFIESHGQTLAARLISPAVETPAANASIEPATAVPASAEAPLRGIGRRRARRARRQLPSTAIRAARAVDDETNEPIAIIGLSGRYPQAPDLDAYWRNLRDGRDCITEVPAERWDWREYYSEDRAREGAHYSKWGGFIEGVDRFDPRFFSIAPRDAAAIDPQERLFLQHAWMAIEDAGYTRASLQIPQDRREPGQVGVYAGVMYGEYNRSGTLASIANRVSYFLNLHGPSLTLDTMCSSSLTALHLACQDLRDGRTSLALAGGVNVSIHPDKYTMLSAGQFISGAGHCQSFGEGGDGYIPGEGVGVAVLKRLSDAVRDGNHIYGVIRGSALNHGGRTNGYTVPNPHAQAAVIRAALTEAGINPRDVSYIEAHGTGTKLGDPIEIAALTKTFNDGLDPAARRNGFCRIGSAKSNIGHCESAAGIAGVTKVLLQMKHRKIVPSLHSQRLNPYIDFDRTPFVVNQALVDWVQPEHDGRRAPRIAGVSSFGAGGSNAHVIIEEYQALDAVHASDDEAFVAPLSARTAGQLQRRAGDLLTFLRRNDAVDAHSLAWTLQAGREAMEERIAFVADSIANLIAQLDAFVSGVPAPAPYWRGQVKAHDAYPVADPVRQNDIERDITARALAALAQGWVEGLVIDWRRLHASSSIPSLISLPTYPFADERYWIEPTSGSASRTQATLHPLVHANTSDLCEQRYTSRFTGSEPFVETVDGDGYRLLPALLMLEQVRFALVSSGVANDGGDSWEIDALQWGEPVVATPANTLHTAVFAHDGGRVGIEIYGVDAAGDETVHLQAHAQLMASRPDDAIDRSGLRAELTPHAGALPDGIARVYHGGGQWLAEFDSSPQPPSDGAAWGLHPELFRRIGALLDMSSNARVVPVSAAIARIASVCEVGTAVWVRTGADGSVDVDALGAQGKAFMQLRGLRVQLQPCVDASHIEVQPADEEAWPIAGARDRGDARHTAVPIAQTWPALRGKPADIALAPAPAASVAASTATAVTLAKPAVTLVDLAAAGSASGAHASPVALFDLGGGIFRIDIATADLAPAIAPLSHALNLVQGEDGLKVLLLADTSGQGWSGARAVCDALATRRVLATLAAIACPVVVLAPFGAAGAGWLLSVVGDFIVLGDESVYGYTDAASGLFPSAGEDRLMRERFGDVLTDDFLYCAAPSAGRQLRERGWTCRIAPVADAQASALQLANDLAQKPAVALKLLATHLRRGVSAAVDALRADGAERGDAGTIVNDTGAPSADAAAPSLEASGAITAELENGALVIGLGAGLDSFDLSALVAGLNATFERACVLDHCRSIVLTMSAADRLADAVRLAGEGAATALLETLLASPLPLIAACESDAEGLAWLASLACDAAVYRRDAHYGVAGLDALPALEPFAAALGDIRAGAALNMLIGLAGDRLSGDDLRVHSFALRVVEHADVLPRALALAASWQRWPLARVRAWKRAQAARVRTSIDEACAVAFDDSTASAETSDASNATVRAPTMLADDEPVTVPLRSAVVTAVAHPDGVVVVTMHDRDGRNMFTPALIDGINEAFAHAGSNPACKAVVVTGFDSYFATGGTRDTLIAIQEGRARFTDERVFQLPMDCPVPVIAALQGHAIGGGWSFGMFADLAVLADESHYVSPYMNYGFTPGAGSTLVFPRRIGLDLARETLLTGAETSGAGLRARGVALPVLPRRDVAAHALALAQRIARQPRSRLVRLKHRFTDAARRVREDVYACELGMHEATFVRDAQTLARIETYFADGALAPVRATSPAPAFEPRPAVASALASNADTAHVPAAAGDMLAGVIDTLRTLLAQELHLQASEIDEHAQFVSLGLDSISGVTWVRRINERYRIDLEATRIYSHPTLARIGGIVLDAAREAGTAGAVDAGTRASAAPPQTTPLAPSARIAPAAPAAVTPLAAAHAVVVRNAALPARAALTSMRRAVRTPRIDAHGQPASTSGQRASQSSQTVQVQTAPPAPQPIAVIGMAGEFPKARDVDAFWRNLAAGLDCIEEVPEARWRLRDYFQPGAPAAGKTYSRWLGALDGYDQFDPLFFNISPTEAECMDPQQRLFLRSAWHCMEDAGYSAKALAGSACGVYVGCGPSDYHQGADDARLSAQGFTGAATSILAARIAYFLDLHGPCVSIDTACSSALVALANACDSLNAGHCDAALAGGVYVMGGPSMHVMTAQAGMLSPDGRCYTFDQRANGFVPGEAVGVLMLKRLDDAERDGDRILAVLRGWGVNQDGKTNGITAPNEDAQSQLLQSVYRRFGIDPDAIDLIEAHGTGTKLGDPIEVAGLKAAYAPFTRRAGYCALGSVKSNIGHCLTAAGAAGVIKLVQALRHRQLPPTLHYRTCNEHIRLDNSPFYVNDRLAPWTVEAGRARVAAISSFGFSGTNAHIVLGEYTAHAHAAAAPGVLDPAGRTAVPLSARTSEQLRQKARDLLAFLREANERGETPDLTEIAYTLQTGRDAMDARAGFLIASTVELAERLDQYLTGGTLPDGVYEGQVREYRDSIRIFSEDAEVRAALTAKWLVQRRLNKLLELWVKGLDFDWRELYGETAPRRVALPGYPFAAERYWIAHAPVRKGAARTELHPLVHRNVSVLSGQRYRSHFGSDAFWVGLRAGGAHEMTPAALLEMARYALADATADATADLGSTAMQTLREVRWIRSVASPFATGAAVELTVDLVARDDGCIDIEIVAAGTGETESQPLARAVAWLEQTQPRRRFDTDALSARCTRGRLDADGAYARLAGAELEIGPSLRTLGTLEFGDGECLVTFDERADQHESVRGCALPPGMVDAAWQAGCLAAFDEHASYALCLPDRLDSLTLAPDHAPVRHAWVTRSAAAEGIAFDIDLLDPQGFVVAELRGLTLAPVSADIGLTIAAPVWDCVEGVVEPHPASSDARVVVIGANAPRHVAALSSCFQQAIFVDANEHTPIDDIANTLNRMQFARLIWIVDGPGNPGLTDESLVADQKRGLTFALRIARALVDAGYESRPLAWDWITFGAVAMPPADLADPTHAGLQGLCGSFADTYAHWALRLCDLPAPAPTEAIAALAAPPAATRGNVFAWRDGEWFGQRLVAVRAALPAANAPSPYRTDGVYVVIGGAGGIGEVWTRHALTQGAAAVVWIGRRPLDAALSARIERAAVNGTRPEYVQADAGDRVALEAAYRQIKARHGAIHGVVHSAVGAFDQSLKTVSETDFREILRAKIDVSVRIAQVFANEALDFALFFSSNASFVHGAGMGGYSAGCTFKDAYALQLNRLWPGVAKVVNWGYWSVGAGVAMSDAMKTFFEVSGYQPLDPVQAMRALDALLAGPFRQWSITKLAPDAALRLASGDEFLRVYDGRDANAVPAALLPDLERVPAPTAFKRLQGGAGQPMEPLLVRLLGAITAATPRHVPSQSRWLAESRKIAAALGQHGAPSLDAAWRAWDDALPGWLADAGQRALVHLVDRCMRALPEILSGARKATDVIFPGASLELVEQVYKTDSHSLAFNESLRETLVAALRARIDAEPGVRLRLFEIGAGTGATSAGILERLGEYRDHIAEYCYTDLSKAFLFHADTTYAPNAPFLRTRLFDVERPLEGQGIDAGAYDFVIAANVIHATRHIRRTLRNTKALLRRGGMLLMNEISGHSICGHVTFGLLEGWWLNQDETLRIPGSPGLEPQVWKRVLGAEGFAPVWLPHPQTHALGQQIIVALSDGIVRQRIAEPPAPVAVPAAPPRASAATAAPARSSTSIHASAVELCKRLIGKALKLESTQIDAHEPLERYGIDSIVIGLVNQQLQQHFGDVSSTLLFEFRTVDALAAHLVVTRREQLAALFGEVEPAGAPVAVCAPASARPAGGSVRAPLRAGPAGARQASRATSSSTAVAIGPRRSERGPIAIVGISGVYPGAADLDTFWRNLRDGHDAIVEIPARRWALDGFYEPDEQTAVDAGRSYSKWGGFVDSFAEFDCLFFGIPPREALNMDPQERMFMQGAWHALENAGYTRATLRDAYHRRVGIFAGITRVGYNLHRPLPGDAAKFWPRTSFASVANRLSYFLDVNGPSLPVDTMCSSSLTAIHEACEHIHNGDCDLALAGGVNLYLHPTSYIDMSSQHMLAPDGRCKSFGAGGNGFVPGEGVGVVLLRPLARAIDDGDTIHGVIRATQVNHGGKTNGYTIPNPVAQAELVRMAIDKAGISAREISYVEAHGTGTELGDPIEISGLQQAFAPDTADTGFCAIGSVKSNIGHLEAAAGIAALTKVLLQFRHGQIAPSLHAQDVNSHIPFERTPFSVSQRLADWTPPVIDGVARPRIAGISSFGAGGANAHVIVEEYRAAPAAPMRARPEPVIVPLSARTAEQLRAKAAGLLAFLRAQRERADLAALAYTLQVGREAMEERLSIVASSAEQLIDRLAAYADGERVGDGAWRGHLPRASSRAAAPVEPIGSVSRGDAGAAIERGLAEGEYAMLAELWANGHAFDWQRLYDGARPRRIELPVYPFSREEYWVEPASAARPAVAAASYAATDGFAQVEAVLARIDRAELDVADAARLIRSLV